MRKIKSFFKARWSFFIGLIFVWVIPLILLSESVSFVKDVSVGIKVTWMGCLVIIVLIFSLRKFIHGQIMRLKHGGLRAVLKCLYKAIACALFLFILAYLGNFAGLLFNWWKMSCVSIFMGLCFYFYDELRASKYEKQQRIEEIKSVIKEEKEKEDE